MDKENGKDMALATIASILKTTSFWQHIATGEELCEEMKLNIDEYYTAMIEYITILIESCKNKSKKKENKEK